MGKNEILTNIANSTGLPKDSCELVINRFAEEVKEALTNGDKVMLKDFISFEVTERPERKGRNPHTNEVVTFPAVKSVKCKVGKAIKDAVNNK